MDPKASHAPLLSYAAGLAPERFTLRPSHPLLIVWLPFSLLAMGLALFGCLRYNAVAGTRFTADQIAVAVVGMNLGPFVGPLFSTGGFGEPFYVRLFPIPVVLLIVGWLPFILIRRPIRTAWALAAIALNALAGVAWYGSAVLALAYYLG